MKIIYIVGCRIFLSNDYGHIDFLESFKLLNFVFKQAVYKI